MTQETHKRNTKRPQIQSSDVALPDDRILDASIDRPLDDDKIYIAQDGDIKDERIKAALDETKAWKAFMKEKVTFMIAETDDPNAPNPVSCGVNGVHRHFLRGRRYTDMRCFVDSLIKCRRTVKTREIKTPDGIDDTEIKLTSVLAYPVQIFDDTPLGNRWFEHQQRNAF